MKLHLMGLRFRETDAVHSSHIMAQGGYLFFGLAVNVKIAESLKSGNWDWAIDAIIVSEYRKRSIEV